MKTVGILTFHYADNYGAVLQTYALRKKINSLADCGAEIINFAPKGFSYSLYKNEEKARQSLIYKRQLFEEFLKDKCGVSGTMISKITGNQYDYYCVGSDQVWNLNFADMEFFLPHIDEDAVRISYAASIGMGLAKAYQQKEIFQKYVSKFKAVSLREREYVDFIRNVCKKECRCVLDPTLLLEESDYTDIVSKDRLKNESFIFFFWLKHDDRLMQGVEFANTVSRKYHLPIVHSIADAGKYMFNMDAGCMMYEGVENFLWYIKNAKFVITNSYHATLFSIQFRTPFYTFVVKSMRSRIDTLVETLGIGDRVVEGYIGSNEMNDKVDFDSIHTKIQEERIASMQFLKEALDIKEDG